MSATTKNSGPGYAQHPEHRVEAKPASTRVRVTFDGEVIADTTQAVLVEESGHAPVYYLPRSDVKMERLVRTEHQTYCPFKGNASYFSLKSGRTAENAVWSYEEPYDEVAVIKDHLAFYPNRVDAVTTG